MPIVPSSLVVVPHWELVQPSIMGKCFHSCRKSVQLLRPAHRSKENFE